MSRRGYWGDIVTGPFIPFGFEYKKEVRMWICEYFERQNFCVQSDITDCQKSIDYQNKWLSLFW